MRPFHSIREARHWRYQMFMSIRGPFCVLIGAEQVEMAEKAKNVNHGAGLLTADVGRGNFGITRSGNAALSHR